MNVFLIIWSAISSGCICLVYSLLLVSKLNWHPGYRYLGVSIAVYLGYWLLLGALQGLALLWKFGDRQFAYEWFWQTSITGFLIMLSHDLLLAISGIDARGQGILILLISLPILAVIGGLLLGTVQFFVIKKRYRPNIQLECVNLKWFAIAFLSWAIGFGGIFAGNHIVPVTILLSAVGGGMKGWFLQKYLKAPI